MKPQELLTIARISIRLVDFPAEQVEDFVEKMFKFYSRSAAYQTKGGIRFELSFDEYLNLFDNNLLSSLARSFAKGTIEKRKHSKYGFVLSWKSRADKLAGVMNPDTATICAPAQSQYNCRYLPNEERDEKARKKMADKKKGKPRPEAVKQQISETKTGQTYDETHRANISASLKGKPKSAESNARRSESAKARWAAKRAAMEARA